jgi:hypothetical protein
MIAEKPWEEPRFYGVSLCYAISDGRIVVGNLETSHRYELKIYDGDGTLLRLIRKDHKPEHLESEEAARLKKNNPLNWEIPEFYMPFSGLEAAEEGRVIARERAFRGGDGEYDRIRISVFEATGKLYATQIIPYYSKGLWANQRLYAIAKNNDGQEVVRVYRVSWASDKAG